MSKYLLLVIITLLGLSSNAQSNISGIIVDKKGEPIIGANVYIENTYDGNFSDVDGKFAFATTVEGMQKLVISYLTYETYYLGQDVAQMKDLDIVLKEATNTLNAVVITAGSFETGDNAKTAVLSPIDVVTTAGAQAGDINTAIATLPGNSTVGEDGRLFVRGGDASETRVFIDGMRVFKPYTTTNSNVPVRSRFSSFLFKGVAFSSGGFSSEYGDALSGVLSMNTTDIPAQNQTDIGVMSLGLTLARTNKWKNDAITFSLGYIDISPYQAIFPDKFDWEKPYRGISGETVYRHKFKSGLYKLYAGGTKSDVIINAEDVNYEDKVKSQIKNDNLYLNSTYKGTVNDEYAVFGGVSYSYDKSALGFNDVVKNVTSQGVHVKGKLTRAVTDRVKITVGSENINQKIKVSTDLIDIPDIKSNLCSAYTEGHVFLSNDFAIKGGVRGEYSDFLEKWNITPRVSLAYKVSEHGQFSLAAGKYFQTPDLSYISSAGLTFENTDQILFNYSYKKKKNILRAELYYKKYNDLVRVFQDGETSSTGHGHAKGFDLFWKDQSSIKNFQYWISYSWLDAEKLYKEFPISAKPNSASTHNLSIVAKYWMPDIRSFVGITYTHGSPRPYDDKNSIDFMQATIKSYNNLSLTWTYLITQQKILFFSLSNIARFKNEFGYQYANAPDENGHFNSRKITPSATSSIFVGFFWTISDDKKANQVDRL